MNGNSNTKVNFSSNDLIDHILHNPPTSVDHKLGEAEWDGLVMFWFNKWLKANEAGQHMERTSRGVYASPHVYELWAKHRDDFEAIALLHKELISYECRQHSSR